MVLRLATAGAAPRRRRSRGRHVMPSHTIAVFLLLALLAGAPSAGQPRAGPGTLGFVDDIVRLPEGDWRDLRAGRTVVRTIPAGGEAHHVALVAAGRTTMTPERFVAGVNDSATLWRGPQVPRSGTFHPVLSAADMSTLALPVEDLRSIRSCRAGDCGVKLAPAEMMRLQQQLRIGDRPWQQALQEEFRALVLDRIGAYRRSGLAGLPSLHDQREAADLDAVFAGLLAALPALARHAPDLAAYIERYPHVPLPSGAQEVQYWLETSETPKPTVQAIHAVLQRRAEAGPVEVLVVSRQIFATHYVNGSLSVSALVRDPDDPSLRYLIYVNRSATDGLGGFLSGLRRFMIERRVRGAARGAFEHLRRALER